MLVTSPDDINFLGKVSIKNLNSLKGMLGLRNHEKEESRVAFVHRAKDRFTYTVRYKYTNEVKDGKIYSKWRTLNVVTFVVKNNKLNVFFSGHSTGGPKHYSKGILNLNRKAYLVFDVYRDELDAQNQLIITEIEALCKRNELQAPDLRDRKTRVKNLTETIYPTWKSQSYTIPGHPEPRYTAPPLFAADVLRTDSIKSVAVSLFEKDDKELEQDFLSAPEDFMDDKIFLYLMLAKKRIPSEIKKQVLHKHLKKENEVTTLTFSNPENGVKFSEITFKQMMTLRSLLKVLDEENNISLLSKTLGLKNPTALQEILGVVNLYTLNKKDIATDMNIRNVLNDQLRSEASWNHVKKSLTLLRTTLATESYTNKADELKSLLQELGKNPNIEASKDSLRVKYEEEEFRSYIRIPCEPNSQSYTARADSRTVSLRIQTTEHTLAKNFSPTKTHFYKLAKKLGMHLSLNKEKDGLLLTTEQYLDFLVGLSNEAEELLEKYNLPATRDNVIEVVVLFFYFSHQSYFDSKQGTFSSIPVKIMKFLAMGIDANVAIYLYSHNVTLRDGKTVIGLPLSWIKTMFGDDEDQKDKDSLTF